MPSSNASSRPRRRTDRLVERDVQRNLDQVELVGVSQLRDRLRAWKAKRQQTCTTPHALFHVHLHRLLDQVKTRSRVKNLVSKCVRELASSARWVSRGRFCGWSEDNKFSSILRGSEIGETQQAGDTLRLARVQQLHDAFLSRTREPPPRQGADCGTRR